MSLDRFIPQQFVSLSKLPDFPDFFVKAKISDELASYKSGRFTEEQAIWKYWACYNRLRLSTLFIYRFLDIPLVADFIDDNVKTQIGLSNCIELPTLFLPGSEGQTAAFIFAQPIQNFFLQYLVTTDIDIESFAQAIDSIFKIDDKNNFCEIKNSKLLVQLISHLKIVTKFINEGLAILQTLLIYAEPDDGEDELHFYLKLFAQYKLNNGLVSYLTTLENGEKITSEYNKDLELAKTKEIEFSSDEENEAETVEVEIINENDFEIVATKEKYRLDLEEHFYRLLNTEMSVFHTFKNNLGLPGSIDPEIVDYLDKYNEHQVNIFAAKDPKDRKTKEQLIQQTHEFLPRFTDSLTMKSCFIKMGELDKSDPKRIRIARDIYYEINETLNCIFYIFKNIVERKTIYKYDRIFELAAELDKKVGRAVVKKSHHPAKPDLDAAKIAKYLKKKKEKEEKKAERKSEKDKAKVESLAAKVKSQPTESKSKSELVVIDPKELFQVAYDACLAKLSLLDEKGLEFDSEHEKIFILLGTVRNADALDRKLKAVKDSVKTIITNAKNRIRAEIKRSFELKEKTHDWQNKLAKMNAELSSLLNTIENNLKTISEIEETRKTLAMPRAVSRRHKLTERIKSEKEKTEVKKDKIRPPKAMRARTVSERLTRESEATLLSLNRRSSEGNLSEATGEFKGFEMDSTTPATTPGSTPVPSPSPSASGSRPGSSILIGLTGEDKKIPSIKLSRHISFTSECTPVFAPLPTPSPSPSPSPVSSPSASRVFEVTEDDTNSHLRLVRLRSVGLSAAAKPFVPSGSAFFSMPVGLKPLITADDDEVDLVIEPINLRSGENVVSSSFVLELAQLKLEEVQISSEVVVEQTVISAVNEIDTGMEKELDEEADELLKQCMSQDVDGDDFEEVDPAEEEQINKVELSIPLSMYFVDGKYSLFTQGLGREVMVKGADVEEDKIEGIWAGAKVEYDEDPVLQVGIGRPRH